MDNKMELQMSENIKNEASMMRILEEGAKLKLEVDLIKQQFLQILLKSQTGITQRKQPIGHKRKNDSCDTITKRKKTNFTACENSPPKCFIQAELDCVKCQLSFQSLDSICLEHTCSNMTFSNNRLDTCNFPDEEDSLDKTFVKKDENRNDSRPTWDTILNLTTMSHSSSNQHHCISTDTDRFSDSEHEAVNEDVSQCSRWNNDSDSLNRTFCVSSDFANEYDSTYQDIYDDSVFCENEKSQTESETKLSSYLFKLSKQNNTNAQHTENSLLNTCLDESFYEQFINNKCKNSKTLHKSLLKKIKNIYHELKYKNKGNKAEGKANKVNLLSGCLNSSFSYNCIEKKQLKFNQTVLDIL